MKMRRSWLLVAYPVTTRLDVETKSCGGRNEHGGILIGRYRGPHSEIIGLTERGLADISSRYSFVKQDSKHQRSALAAWKRSGGTDTYLGEWHTHPFGGPSPSATDTDTWKTAVEAAKRTMFFAIVSPQGWAIYIVQPRFWRRTEVRELKVIENAESGQIFS